jgi:hypothetical protein
MAQVERNVKSDWFPRLTLKHYHLPSRFTFNLNLRRRCTKGNSFVAYDIDLAVYYDATWAFRGLGYGIDGALQVNNQTGETVVSITAAEANAAAAAQAARTRASAKRPSSNKGLGGVAGHSSPTPLLLSAALSKGFYRVTLYGVYDEAAYNAAYTAGRDPPRVDYTEPTLCGVSSWAPLVTGPMLHCALPAEEEAEEDAFADQTDHKGLNTGSELREDQMVTKGDGTRWRVDPSFDGAYVDLHLGMDGLTMQLDNHFGGDE